MGRLQAKRQLSKGRIRRVRNVIRGDADRPRLSVNITNTRFTAQIINDMTGKTLAHVTDKPKTINIESATKFGEKVAGVASKAKVNKVVFDRGDKKYHGRLKAIADSARSKGLEF